MSRANTMRSSKTQPWPTEMIQVDTVGGITFPIKPHGPQQDRRAGPRPLPPFPPSTPTNVVDVEVENGLANPVRPSKVRPTVRISPTLGDPPSPLPTRKKALTVKVWAGHHRRFGRLLDSLHTVTHDPRYPETNLRLAAWHPVAAGAKSTECVTAKRRKRSAAGRTAGSRDA